MIDEDYAIQQVLVLHPRLAARLWEERLEARYLRTGKLEKITAITTVFMKRKSRF